MEEYSQDTVSEFFLELSNLLNDAFQSSHSETTELINQLFVIAEDVPRVIRGNDNGSTRAVFQTTKTFLIVDIPGRPKVNISQDALVYFRSLGFKWNCIGLSDVLGYSNISDDELDRFVSEYRQVHGVMCGRSMVTGYLKSIGINVQQHRVTQSLARDVCREMCGIMFPTNFIMFSRQWMIKVRPNNNM